MLETLRQKRTICLRMNVQIALDAAAGLDVPFLKESQTQKTFDFKSRIACHGKEAMQFNLFSWIREGVKRSVLLGVSDAMDHIGTPDDQSKINQDLLAGLGTSRSTTKRKRLGRSLKDLNPTEEKSSS